MKPTSGACGNSDPPNPSPGPELYTVSLFGHKRDNTPKEAVWDWETFQKRLTTFAIRRFKDGPLWSPATFRNTHRCNDNVIEVCALVLDYDHGATIEDAHQTWKDYGHLVHTTFSHTEDHPRFRVILPLATPCPADQHEALWEWAWKHTGGQFDRAARDAARMFYLPVHPPVVGGEE